MESDYDLKVRRKRWRLEARRAYGRLSWWQKLRVRMGAWIYIRDEQLCPGRADNPEEPLFLFWCSSCGAPDMDYGHGWKKRLDCSMRRAHLKQATAPPSLASAA